MNTKRPDKNLRLQRQTLRTLSDVELAGVDGGRRGTSGCETKCGGRGAACTTTSELAL
jgi:hypothetical protein